MIKLFISYCMEYEAGWGSKPDGITLSPDIDALNNFIKPYNDRTYGSYQTYWNYSKPEEIWCSKDDFEKIKYNFENEKKIVSTNSLKSFDIDFFKKI